MRGAMSGIAVDGSHLGDRGGRTSLRNQRPDRSQGHRNRGDIRALEGGDLSQGSAGTRHTFGLTLLPAVETFLRVETRRGAPRDARRERSQRRVQVRAQRRACQRRPPISARQGRDASQQEIASVPLRGGEVHRRDFGRVLTATVGDFDHVEQREQVE